MERLEIAEGLLKHYMEGYNELDKILNEAQVYLLFRSIAIKNVRQYIKVLEEGSKESKVIAATLTQILDEAEKQREAYPEKA